MRPRPYATRGQRQQRRWDDATNPKGNFMRTSFGPLLGLSLAFLATPALADETDPPAAVTINGTATVVSDYRFRGISQTNKRPALQGSITLTHKSGVYASVWGSSIDDYVAAGGDQELDLIVGFKKSFGGTTVDVGGLYYYYPGSSGIIPGYNSDFFEPYAAVSQAIGPVTAKATVNYAPKSKALAFRAGVSKEDNLYGALDLSSAIPNTPVSLSAHLGHNFTRSFLSGGVKYTDWALGATYTYKAFTLGVSYVDTNATLFSGIPNANRNITKGGVVGTLGVSF
jgi:uncharacterized protein (TIGR02001 family)